MTDARSLLERHRPRLVYDSQEAYFADAASIWTDSPTNVLKRADGTVVARPSKLSLAFLGTHVYGDGKKVLASDVIGETTRDYERHAAALHRQARYRDRVYGHARRDTQGRLWLQYWLFYYYNDFQLLGPLLSGGKHEGDWELVQLRLDAAEQPVEAVFSQHTHAESKPWANVRKSGPTPLVYVARGSHANYFGAGFALERQLARPRRRQGPADHAHARSRRGHDARGCCGRAVGGTRRRRAPRSTPTARTARGAERTG